MRPIWRGNISFGLVYIPVSVYPATREESLSFRQLRKKDLSPIRYKKVADADMQEVPAHEIVKGFEYERGRYVVVSDEDFEKVRIESTRSIDISDFVDIDEVDPKFFYRPYFLEPQKGGDKAYALLHRALTRTGKIGIAKVAIWNREYLAAVKPDGLFLVLELMHFAHEILSADELVREHTKELSEQEIKMAETLIDTMSAAWQPHKYKDEYRDALLDIIEQKKEKKEIADRPLAPRPATKVVDLLKVLQESIDRSRAAKPQHKRRQRGRSTTVVVKRRRRS